MICIEFVCIFLYCLSVSVRQLAVKTACEMTYIVSNGALNSTPTKPKVGFIFVSHFSSTSACMSLMCAT